MNRKLVGAVVTITLIVILVGVWQYLSTDSASTPSATPLLADTVSNYEDFKQATQRGNVRFPDDFGKHPEYLIEWWYYTGNVQTVEGRAFGYQLTFFRRGLTAYESSRSSEFATTDVYMAHFSLTDVEAGDFYHYERFQRGGDLANAEADPYQVWLDDWSVEEVGEGIYRLNAETDEVAVSFTLTDMKGPVLQGDEGLSVKNTDNGYASHYFSQTRLETYGTLRVGSSQYTVTGSSWMDREWSTPRDNDITGWDWFALQLSDGRDLMFYQIRQSDGSIEEATSGTLVDPEGNTTYLSREDVQLEVLAEWSNPDGYRYPAQWRLVVPLADLDLIVTPVVQNQELRESETYWEGAVSVTDSKSDIQGVGYVELTGYVNDLSLMR